MQSVSTFEEGSTGIESKRENTCTSPDDTENQSVDLLAEDCVNYCTSNGIENSAEILRYAHCDWETTGCARDNCKSGTSF